MNIAPTGEEPVELVDSWKLALRLLVSTLPLYSFRFGSEAQLHRGIALALEEQGILFEHEVVAGADRFDFRTTDGIVIEAKIKGSLSEALRQSVRYLERDDVRAVIIAATPRWADAGWQGSSTIASKPLHLIRLRAQAF